MYRLLICLILAVCAFALTAPNAEACGGRVAGALLRVGTAPLRLVNHVRVNRLEARAARGNRLAAARTEHTQARRGSGGYGVSYRESVAPVATVPVSNCPGGVCPNPRLLLGGNRRNAIFN